MTKLTDRGQAFRAAIAGFIDARRNAKLKGDDGDADAGSKYDFAGWIADAARRIGQIQAVTHVLKATHPDARGTSLHVTPSSLPHHAEIGSHLLGEDYAGDVVGNAAALDVFKLLKLEVDGKRLLDWMQAGDLDLQDALSDDVAQARDWMRAFASLVRKETQPASHPMAKQLYWLTGEDPQNDAQYHLLQPMFASSLAHRVHADIQDARFGDANKEARHAKRDNQPSNDAYREYRDLVARKLGGTKPQNISQLNSERGGVNYLLASLPQRTWKPLDGGNLLKLDSVFEDKGGVFLYFGEIRQRIRELADFLKISPDQNQATRTRVDAIMQEIADALALFGVEVRGRHAAAWTRDTTCRLPPCERLWLDPERAELPERNDPEHPHWHEEDLAFKQAYELGGWADEVAGRFGRWITYRLRERSGELVRLGEAEVRHFARQAVLDVAWPIPRQRRAKIGVA